MDKQKLKHVCKFCKKRFVCGRSLGGHIRCHLPKKTLRVSTDLSDVLLKSSATSSSSETEPGKVSLSKMNQGHGKSKRSSLVGNHSHSSISEVIEDEQQEVDVAMCLILLSRDVGPWGRGKTTNGNRGENKRKRGKKVSTAVNGEKLVSVDSEDQQKGLKMKSVEVLESGFRPNDHSLELSEDKKRKREQTQGKKTVFTAVNAEKLVSDASEHLQKGVGVSENEFLSKDQSFDLSDNVRKCVEMEEFGKSLSKRSTFECTTCNKVFYSHQALGGHKASHKKSLDAPETNEEFNPQHKDDVFTEIGLGSSPTLSKKAVQKHECPICFRVFPSGQALGGHKRSHLVANNNGEKIDQTCQTAVDDVIEGSSSSKPRELLNLNLNLTPDQQVQEEGDTAVTAASSSNSLVRVIKPFWWVENPHKREGFLSLISN